MANLLLLADDAARLQSAAEEDNKLGVAVAALGKRKEILEAMDKVQGISSETVDLRRNPEFLQLMQRILAALELHPAARDDVERALTVPAQGGDS